VVASTRFSTTGDRLPRCARRTGAKWNPNALADFFLEAACRACERDGTSLRVKSTAAVSASKMSRTRLSNSASRSSTSSWVSAVSVSAARLARRSFHLATPGHPHSLLVFVALAKSPEQTPRGWLTSAATTDIASIRLLCCALMPEFPVLQSADALPGNLPVPPSSFVGRDREIAELVVLLRDSADRDVDRGRWRRQDPSRRAGGGGRSTPVCSWCLVGENWHGSVIRPFVVEAIAAIVGMTPSRGRGSWKR
jgi:hypothetical protein